MTPDNTNIDETNRLIASNKVEGTAVYNRQGEKLGTVYNFMVDKRSGKADTRSCHSAGSWAWVIVTIHCRGTC